MAAIVVPFRGAGGKSRLAPAPPEVRAALSLAMLADVLAAATQVGATTVVTADDSARALAAELGAAAAADAGTGQGAAVANALALRRGPALVVNADVPAVVPDDLRDLLVATPPRGIALVAAADGTTNALSLSDASLFQPLYGPRSARRFAAAARAAGGEAVRVEIASLAADVDTLDDLRRVEGHVGPRTVAALELAALAPAR